MAERRQVAAVGRPEADASRHRFAGRRVDDLDLDALRRRRQRLDRDATETAASALRREPRRRRRRSAPDRERRIGREREVDERPGSAVPARLAASPADDRSDALPWRRWRRRRRRAAARKTWPRSTPTPAVVRGARSAASAAAATASGDARAAEGRDGRDHDAAALVDRCERLHPQTRRDRRRLAGPRCAAATAAMSPVGLGTESATPVWAGPQLPGRMPSRPASPGLGIAAGRRDRMRAAPVERLVDQVRDRGERALAPADDALVDLEPAADDVLDRPPEASSSGVSRERLPDRRDPADRQVRRAALDAGRARRRRSGR